MDPAITQAFRITSAKNSPPFDLHYHLVKYFKYAFIYLINIFQNYSVKQISLNVQLLMMKLWLPSHHYESNDI